MIYPVIRSKGYMAKTPVAGITRWNQSMKVATDRGAALQPNGLLTPSDPISFCICKSVLNLPSKWCRRWLNRTELERDWYLSGTLVQRFESYIIEYLPSIILVPVKILLFNWYLLWGREVVNKSNENFIRNLINPEKEVMCRLERGKSEKIKEYQ